MTTGARSLLAPWAGGAAVQTGLNGPQSLLAFWMGGASAHASTGRDGSRSLLARWMGGATAHSSAAHDGPRSMCAFWMGGGCEPGVAPLPGTPVIPVGPSGGGPPARRGGPRPHRKPAMMGAKALPRRGQGAEFFNFRPIPREPEPEPRRPRPTTRAFLRPTSPAFLPMARIEAPPLARPTPITIVVPADASAEERARLIAAQMAAQAAEDLADDQEALDLVLFLAGL